MNPIRLIVCGCRDWTDRAELEYKLDQVIAELWRSAKPGQFEMVIVHGHHHEGADKMADDYAKDRGIAPDRHPADWDTHGQAAGPIRNRKMAQLGAAVCLAFWDGLSRGTLDMIKQATRAGIPVRIFPNMKR